MTRVLLAVVLLLGTAAFARAQAPSAPAVTASAPNTCVTCHAADANPRLSAPVTAHAGDVHASRGLTCVDCHGGNASEPDKAKSMAASADFKGRSVGATCGSCHAMFATLFEQSSHTLVFEKACVDCHGSHAIAPASDALIGNDAGAICATCHTEKDDPGFVGAGAMRAALDRLSGGLAAATTVVERARHAGMDVGDQDLLLGKARDQLMLARTEVHGFSTTRVEAVTAEGDRAAAEAEAGGHRALEELSFRRRGLTASLVLILAVVAPLTLKIRQIDRRRERQV